MFFMLLAYIEVSIVLFLTYYLSVFFIKKFFGKMYGGNSLLNKAIPFFIVSLGIFILYRLIGDLLEKSGIASLHSLDNNGGEYFSALIYNSRLILVFIAVCIAISLYHYDAHFQIRGASNDSPSKVILSFALIHILITIADKAISNLEYSTDFNFIPELYSIAFPLYLALSVAESKNQIGYFIYIAKRKGRA